MRKRNKEIIRKINCLLARATATATATAAATAFICCTSQRFWHWGLIVSECSHSSRLHSIRRAEKRLSSYISVRRQRDWKTKNENEMKSFVRVRSRDRKEEWKIFKFPMKWKRTKSEIIWLKGKYRFRAFNRHLRHFSPILVPTPLSLSLFLECSLSFFPLETDDICLIRQISLLPSVGRSFIGCLRYAWCERVTSTISGTFTFVRRILCDYSCVSRIMMRSIVVSHFRFTLIFFCIAVIESYARYFRSDAYMIRTVQYDYSEHCIPSCAWFDKRRKENCMLKNWRHPYSSNVNVASHTAHDSRWRNLS